MDETGDDIWAGFYKKTLQTRQDQINLLYPGLEAHGLPPAISDNMVENSIGVFSLVAQIRKYFRKLISLKGILSLPLALGLNFKINGRHVVVPLCTEEPSVVGM